MCPKPRPRTPNPWLIGELMEELQEMTALFWTLDCQLVLWMWRVLITIAWIPFRLEHVQEWWTLTKALQLELCTNMPSMEKDTPFTPVPRWSIMVMM
jgi:hypothetical protein